MRDTTVVVLVLILASLLIDTLVNKCAQWRKKDLGWQGTAVIALIQGLAIAIILWLFDRAVLPAIFAGCSFALAWGSIRWGLSRFESAFASLAQYLLQIAALTIIWLSVEGYWHWLWESAKALASAHNLLVLLGYVLVLRPASALIGAVLTPWLHRVKDENSLENAGAMIGYLERVLILSFVLLDQWGAIGFLLTAKSILRFNDLKGDGQRSMSEYVLLGTLLSFTVSIALGLMVLKLSGK